MFPGLVRASDDQASECLDLRCLSDLHYGEWSFRTREISNGEKKSAHSMWWTLTDRYKCIFSFATAIFHGCSARLVFGKQVPSGSPDKLKR